MSRLRKIIEKSKTSVGLQLALAMLVPAKGKAGTEVAPRLNKEEQSSKGHESADAPPHLTGRWDFSRLFTVAADPEVVSDASESAAKAQDAVKNAWTMTVKAANGTDAKQTATGADGKAADGKFVPAPMTHEEVRLWLSSFNAGPYAVLKYKGDVPYEETKNYVPRVLKYYEEVEESPYDEQIEKAAAKWGHDPRMIRAVMATESYFKNDTVSHAGARGLMQVMPVVWKDIQKKYELDWEYSTGVFEPEKNIEVACAYLAWLRYDFLPRHFEAYDRNPDAPVILVRDHDRGVPDRESPRIIAASDETTKRGVDVASVDAKDLIGPSSIIDLEKAASPSASAEPAVEKTTESTKPAEQKDTASSSKSAKKEVATAKSEAKRGKIEVTDAAPAKARKSSNGKSRVVIRGGTGKKVSISVDAKGKVTAGAADKSNSALGKAKQPELARASSKSDDGQGG